MKSIHILAIALPVFLALPAHAALRAGSRPTEWAASPEHHKVTIQREAADDAGKKLIAAAEKSLPDAAALAKATQKKDGAAAVQSGPWWNKEVLGIRIPFAVTADAVQYYTDLVNGYGQQKLVRFVRPSSEFAYHAKVTKHEAYELDGKPLQNVAVVTMNLKFRQNFVATVAEAFRFEKSRVVIFDKDGKILGIQGDGDTEVPVMAM